MQISRRALLQKAGFLSLLYFTGYASRVLCYNSPRETGKSIKKKPKTDLNWDSKICILGTRGVGFQVSNKLHTFKRKQGFDALLFSPEMVDIYKYLEDRHVIFLVGSLEDNDFWIARDLVVAAKPTLIVSLITYNVVEKVTVLHGNLQSNEGIILLPRHNTLPVASKIIQDFCWSITHTPKLICLDFADIRYGFSGKIFMPLLAESNSFQAKRVICTLVEKNKNVIEITEALYLILLMDHNIDDVLGNAIELFEHVYSIVINNDVDVFFSLDPPHHSDIDFRFTGFISIDPELFKSNKRASENYSKYILSI